MNKQRAADYLTKLRKEKGLLQTDLAEMIHVSPQAVSKWETGESLPDIDSLERLSVIYGVTINEILAGEPEEEKDKEKKDKEEIAVNKSLSKNSLFSIIFGGAYFILALLFGAIPLISGFNAYQIIFANGYQNGNTTLLLNLLILISLCSLSIVMGVLKTEKRVLYVIRLVISYLNLVYLTCFFCLFCSFGSAGLFLFEIMAIVSCLLLQFMKVAKTSVKGQIISDNITVSISTFFMGAMVLIPAVFSDKVSELSFAAFFLSFLAFIGLGFMGLYSKNKKLFSILRYILLGETFIVPSLIVSAYVFTDFTIPSFMGIIICLGYLVYLMSNKKERTYGMTK